MLMCFWYVAIKENKLESYVMLLLLEKPPPPVVFECINLIWDLCFKTSLYQSFSIQ